MLEKMLDLKNTLEGKLLAVFMSVVLVMSMTNILAFAGDEAQKAAESAPVDATVEQPVASPTTDEPDAAPATTPAVPDSVTPATEETAPVETAPVETAPVEPAPTESLPAASVDEAVVTFETENAFVSVKDQVLSGTTLTAELHKELKFTASADAGFELETVKAKNAANADVPVTTQDGVSTIAAEYVDSTLVVTVTAAAIPADEPESKPAVETTPITSDTKIEAGSDASEPETDGSGESVESDKPAGDEPSVEAPADEAGAADEVVDEAEAEEPVEDTIVEVVADVSNPAFEGYAQAGSVIVKVTAAEGVLPEGTMVQATEIKRQDVVDAVAEKIEDQGKTLEDAMVIDVTLLDKDGKEIQPEGAVNVCFFDGNVEGDEIGVYRVSDDAATVETIGTRQADAAVQSFDVDHFTMYVAAGLSSKGTQFITGGSYTVQKNKTLLIKASWEGSWINEHTWTSSDESIATVSMPDPSKHGDWVNVTGVSEGTVTLTHKYPLKNGGNVVETVIVTVTKNRGYYADMTPYITNSEVAYAYYQTKSDALEIASSGGLIPVTGVVSIDDFVSKSHNGYLVFFVRPASGYLLTGVSAHNSSQAGSDIYSVDGTLGAIKNYPGVRALADLAKSQGYVACFGYSRNTGGPSNVVGDFTIDGVKPTFGVSATSNKTTDVKPGDTLEFTVSISPETKAGSKDLTVEGVSVTALTINGTVYELEVTSDGAGSYTGTLEYTATEADCELGEVVLNVSAAVDYSYEFSVSDRNNNSDPVYTQVTTTNSTTSVCSIAEQKHVLYLYNVKGADGIDAGAYPDAVKKAPVSDKAYYYEKDTVNVAETPLKNGAQLDDPSNKGYWTFDGWFLNGSPVTYAETTMGNSSLLFYGTWTFHGYDTLVYDANGGEGMMDSVSAAAGKNLIVAQNGFVNDGYEFIGWNTAPDGSGANYSAGDEYLLAAGGGTLYAQWKASEATVSVWFYKAAGNGAAYYVTQDNGARELVASGSGYANLYSKTVYGTSMEGYSEEQIEAFANATYTYELTGEYSRYEGYDVYVNSVLVEDKSALQIKPGDDVRYHVAAEASHTVTYTATEHGSGRYADEGHYYKGDSVKLASFEESGLEAHDGYTFDHWELVSGSGDLAESTYTMGGSDAVLNAVFVPDADTAYAVERYMVNADHTAATLYDRSEGLTGTTDEVARADGADDIAGYTYQPAFDKNGMKTVSSGVIAGDGTLVLKLYYTPNADELSYEANDGTGAMDATEGVVSEVVSVAANEFERSGYRFTGWNTAADGTGKAYEVGNSYALTPGDDVLYAQWAPYFDLSAEGFELVYDGDEHGVSLLGTLLDTDEVTYVVTKADGTTSTVNSFTDVADSASVVVTVVRDGEVWTSEPIKATITPYKVKVTVDGKTKTLGMEDPEFTGTVGLLVSEGDLGTVTFGRAAGDEGKEGVDDDITLVPYFDGSVENPNANYDVTIVPNKLEIVEGLSLAATGFEGPYDGIEHPISVSTTPDIEGALVEFSSDGGKTWSTEVPSVKNVDEPQVYTVRVSAPGYVPKTVDNVKLAVTPLAITVTPNASSKPFGEEDPVFTYETGRSVVEGETPKLEGQLLRESGEGVGGYAFDGSELTLVDNGDFKASNYTLNVAAGTFSIKQVYVTRTVEKIWSNPGQGLEANPTIELQLYRDNAPYRDSVVLANGTTKYAFDDLPLGKEKGAADAETPYAYRIAETTIGGTTVTNDTASVSLAGVMGEVEYGVAVEEVEGGFVVTNTRLTAILTLRNTVIDQTVARAEGLAQTSTYRVDGVQGPALATGETARYAVKLGGTSTAAIVAAQTNQKTWRTSWQAGSNVKQGATMRVAVMGDTTVDVTNTRVPIRYSISKMWVTDDESLLPSALAYKVYQSTDINAPFTTDYPVVFEGSMDDWRLTNVVERGEVWSGEVECPLFPAFSLEGTGYHYNAREDEPESYVEPQNGYTGWSADCMGSPGADGAYPFVGELYNYYAVTQVSGTKTWTDVEAGVVHDNATEVQLTLQRSSDSGRTWTDVDGAVPTWSGDTYTFSGLAKYRNVPFTYEYRVVETPVEGYYTTQNGTDFENRAIVPVSLTAASQSWTYDGLAHENGGFLVAVNGDAPVEMAPGSTYTFPNGDVLSVTVEGSVTNVADTAEGNNEIVSWTLTDTSGNDIKEAYDVTVAPGTLSVTKAPLEVIVRGNTDEATFDGSEHEVNGFVDNGGDKASVALADGAAAHAVGLNVGAYPMELTEDSFAVESANYDVSLTVIDGGLTILPADTMGVSAPSVFETYDGSSYSTTAEASVPGAEIRYYDEETGTFDLEEPPAFKDAGEHVVRFRATHPNFDAAEGSATVTIAKREVTLTSATASKPYDGEPLFAESVKVGGRDFAPGEGASFYGFASVTDASAVPNEFSYKLDEGTDAGNYDVKTANGTLTVTKAALAITVTGAQASGIYDGAAHVAEGFTVSDNAEGKAEISLTDPAAAHVSGTNAGTYPMNLSASSFAVESKNYEVTLTVIDGSVTVTPATLLIAAADASKTYGQLDPELQAEVRGLVAGEEFEGSYDLARVAGESAGRYAISVDHAVSTNPNYLVTTAPATFTIVPADAVTIIVGGGTKTYDGTPLEPNGFTSSGLASGDYVEVVYAGTQTDAGSSESNLASYVIRNAAGEDVTASYQNVRVQPGTLTVEPASAIIVVNDAGKVAGADDPSFTGSVSGLVSDGDLGTIGYVRSGGDEAPGTYADVLTATFTANPNYTVEVVPGTFTIAPAPVAPVTPVTPTTPTTPTAPTTPTTPTPLPTPAAATAPGTPPADNPLTPIIAPVVDALEGAAQAVIGDNPTPLAAGENEPREAEIDDNGTPLAQGEHVWCWVHFYIILGIIVTALYAACVALRRGLFSRKLKAYENNLTGGGDPAPGTPSKSGGTPSPVASASTPVGAGATMATGLGE